MTEIAPRAERLRLSSRIAIETADGEAVVVYHPDRLSRLRLTEPLYRFMLRFTEPATLDEVDPAGSTQLKRCVDTLVSKGFLVPADAPDRDAHTAPDRRLAPVADTLFGCPRGRPGGPATRVSVLGVPFDLGTSTWAGARWAPAEIRKRSRDYAYHVDFASGRPLGWFDVQHRRRILAGVTFGDWGDVVYQYGEPPEELYRRTADLVAEAVAAGSFPLVIGGDHSVAYAAAEALQRGQRLAVLYLDAHTDFKPLAEGACHNHSSTARRIVGLPNVEIVVQVGHRGYTLHDKVSAPWAGLRMLTLWDVREQGVQAVVDALPADVACYISIDVDVLDPVHAPATANLTPGGFTPDELKSVLRGVGEARRVVGMDFSGVTPERDTHFLTSQTACDLMLVAAGAALSR